MQNLAYRIVEQLDGFATLVERRGAQRIRITGLLPLATESFATRKNAHCSFEIQSDWASKIPEITCREPWLIMGRRIGTSPRTVAFVSNLIGTGSKNSQG